MQPRQLASMLLSLAPGHSASRRVCAAWSARLWNGLRRRSWGSMIPTLRKCCSRWGAAARVFGPLGYHGCLALSAHASHSHTTAHVHRRCALGLFNTQGKKTRAQFSNWLCYELTGVCKRKPPPLPKVRQIAAARGLVLISDSFLLHHVGCSEPAWPLRFPTCMPRTLVSLRLALLVSSHALHLSLHLSHTRRTGRPAPPSSPSRRASRTLSAWLGRCRQAGRQSTSALCFSQLRSRHQSHAHTSQPLGCEVHALAQIRAHPHLRPVLPLPPLCSVATGPGAAGQPVQPGGADGQVRPAGGG